MLALAFVAYRYFSGFDFRFFEFSIGAILLFFTILMVIYQVLFESRARYIFIYLPIFIVGAAFGLNFILEVYNGRNEKR